MVVRRKIHPLLLLPCLALACPAGAAPPAPAVAPVVDKFGQPFAQTWPGKVLTDADLARAARAETAALASWIRPPGRDVYGGWSGSPLEGRLLRTRFFHTVEIENTWWLVTPEGDPFLSLGCLGVRAGDVSLTAGRESLFAWLPDPRDVRFAPALAGEGKAVSFFRANLIRKYDPLTVAKGSLEMAVKRMRAWGLNTAGPSSDQGLFAPEKVPYVVELSPPIDPAAERAAKDHPVPRAPGSDIPDVYDPNFAAQWDAYSPVLKRFAQDSWCLGYTADGGVRWSKLTSPFALPPGFASRAAFTASLKQEYGGDVSKFNRAWGTSLASLDGIAALTEAAIKTSAARTDADAFVQQFAAAYFETIRRAILAGDKNHLFLGVRFQGDADVPAPVLRAAARSCDVLSFDGDHGLAPPVDRLGRAYRIAQKPLWISAFTVGTSQEAHGLDPGPVAVPTQAARGEAAARYIEAAFRLPYLVGVHWLQWVDQPYTGRARDGQHRQVGLVDITDTPYGPLIEALKTSSAAMYEAHDRPPASPGGADGKPAPPGPRSGVSGAAVLGGADRRAARRKR